MFDALILTKLVDVDGAREVGCGFSLLGSWSGFVSASRSFGSWHQRNPSKVSGFGTKEGSLLIGPEGKQMCVPVGRSRPSERVMGSLTMRWKDTGGVSMCLTL